MFGLNVDRTLKMSLSQQLAAQLRRTILAGKLKQGERLPSSRDLAVELHIARNVVVQVYEQLAAEGYLESRVGAGTFVAELPPWQGELAGASDRGVPMGPQPPSAHREHSQSQSPPGNYLGTESANRDYPGPDSANREHLIDFNPGTPDTTLFPRNRWAAILKEICLDAPDSAFGYGLIKGERSLRRAVAHYLFRAKGIDCRPEQIVITSGAAQGICLLSLLIRDSTGHVLVEDPGDNFTRNIFKRHGLSVLPVPVDEHGMQTAKIPKDRDIRLIHVVPSHQFPLGGILPIRRRLALLNYAREREALVVEDDYDSEFRFRGEPIQSLYCLDPDRVIYMGTFSKILSPGLRLGFMIVPDHLRERLCRLKKDINMRTSTLKQLVMARFIERKHLDRHIYRMKKVYAMRRKCLIDAVTNTLGERVQIGGESAGLHIVVEFRDHCFVPQEFELLRHNGVSVDWVEDYAIQKGGHLNRLVLGYGGLEPDSIAEGVRKIRQVLGSAQTEQTSCTLR